MNMKGFMARTIFQIDTKPRQRYYLSKDDGTLYWAEFLGFTPDANKIMFLQNGLWQCLSEYGNDDGGPNKKAWYRAVLDNLELISLPRANLIVKLFGGQNV